MYVELSKLNVMAPYNVITVFTDFIVSIQQQSNFSEIRLFDGTILYVLNTKKEILEKMGYK